MRAFDPAALPAPRSPTPLWPDLRSGGPVDLELGAGSGLHAIRYASRHPERHLIAIERTTKAERLFSRRAHHPHLTNLTVIRADAIHWVAAQVPERSIERCYILYPNPYPKARHRNLRWHNMPFMGFLKSRLTPGALVVTATNEEFYAAEALTIMTATWGFHLVEDRIISPAEEPRTHFEKKYLARGERCRNLVFSLPVSV